MRSHSNAAIGVRASLDDTDAGPAILVAEENDVFALELVIAIAFSPCSFGSHNRVSAVDEQRGPRDIRRLR
jgi:hypothetical protein